MKTIKRVSAIVLVLAIVMTFFASALAATNYYTTGRCNMRKGPGLDYRSRQTIPSGVKLTKKDSAKDERGVTWIKCSYNGMTGWVSTVYLKKNGESHKTRVVATDGSTYIRRGPDRDSRILGTLPKGKSATYLQSWKHDAEGRSYKWYKVTYKGITGYVSSRYAKLAK